MGCSIYRPTYAKLLRVCSKGNLGNRAVQEIRGATSAPPIVDALLTPGYLPDYQEVSLSDDEEVQGWLMHMVGVVPLRVLVVLHKIPRQTKVGNRWSLPLSIILTRTRDRARRNGRA